MTIKGNKNLDNAARVLLLRGKLPEHEVPKYIKAGLERKFAMRVGRNSKFTMKEVK